MKSSKVDIPLMVASLALSLFLWVVVQIQLGAKTIPLRIPLKIVGLAKKTTVDDPPAMIDVETTATSEQADQLEAYKPELYAELDMKGRPPGSYQASIVIKHPQTDLVFTPLHRKVSVTIDSLTETNIDVKVVLKGELPPDKAWVGEQIQPRQVRVSGPKNLVLSALARVELDRSSYRENMQPQAAVKLVDAQGEPVEGLTVEPDTVTITPVVQPIKTVKIRELNLIGQPPAGYRVGVLQLYSIVVRGPKKALDALKDIQLPRVDVSGFTQSMTLRLTPYLPKDIALLTGKTVEVTIPIEVDPNIPTGNQPIRIRTASPGQGNTLP